MTRINTTGTLDLDTTRRVGRSDAHQGGVSATTARTKSQPTDRVELSSTSGDVARLRDSAAASSDIRQDRVDALRAIVQSGNYNPSGRVVADAIIKDERG